MSLGMCGRRIRVLCGQVDRRWVVIEMIAFIVVAILIVFSVIVLVLQWISCRKAQKRITHYEQRLDKTWRDMQRRKKAGDR